MAKICPNCKRKQKDERLIACPDPNCGGSLYVDEKDLVKTFTREELQIIATFLLKDWRVYLIAGIFLLAGVMVLYWQIHGQIKNEIQTFQIAASNQIVAAYSQATNQLSDKFQIFTQDSSNQIALAYCAVTNEIVDDFREPKIRQTVEQVAKGQAKEILTANVEPAVDKFSRDADLLRLSARAQAYDFGAYQQLQKMGYQTNDEGKLASKVISEIDRVLERDRAYDNQIERRTLTEVSGSHIYGGPFTSDEIALRFPNIEQDQSAYNREGFINTASDMNNPGFLYLFIQCLTNETDLSVADNIAAAISKLSKQDFHAHDITKIEEWWQSNQKGYTNWPTLDFNNAFNKFGSVNYSDAANSFEKVLKADPSADMSRAFAIACNWEIGNTNMANTLLNGFNDQNTRWATWASAVSMLEAGDISNATVKLAFIDTNFPTIVCLPSPQYNIWRKVDWKLYNKLITSNK